MTSSHVREVCMSISHVLLLSLFIYGIVDRSYSHVRSVHVTITWFLKPTPPHLWLIDEYINTFGGLQYISSSTEYKSVVVDNIKHYTCLQWGPPSWQVETGFTVASFELQPTVGPLWGRFWRSQGINMSWWQLVGHYTFQIWVGHDLLHSLWCYGCCNHLGS